MSFTKDQIVQYVYNSKPAIKLYHSSMAIGFWPDFPDYKIEDFSWFLEILKITDINSIDELITNNEEALKRYISHIYANSNNPWRVTPGFLCELALIAKYPKSFTTENLVKHGWDKDIAFIVISAANKFSPSIA
ncbi:hypothetical protein [Delftia tsuruhatensis]|uniref:hypothetical protein n=1 Tax=Delftia tsuruhatensis TaxID=180282 RepID=UPI0028A0A138|nr:hypothetical protein [Delftia tsuruhatensis]